MTRNRARARKSDRFLRRDVLFLAVCPAIGVVIALIFWGVFALKLDEQRHQLVTGARRETAALAQTYARNLTSVIAQVDQMSRQLKYQWETSGRGMRLETMKMHGMFLMAHVRWIAIVDAHGQIVSTTQSDQTANAVNDVALLQTHMMNNSDAMRITKVWDDAGPPSLYITRRLETPDEVFDGMVLIAVSPAFFTEIAASPLLGTDGFLSFLDSDYTELVSQSSHTPTTDPHVLQFMPRHLAGRLDAFLLAGDWFVDAKMRMTAVAPLDGYPYAILVGLGFDEILAPNRQAWQTAWPIIASACAVLAALSLAGTIFLYRAIRREHRSMLIESAYRAMTDAGRDAFFMWSPLPGTNDGAPDFELVDCNERGAAMYQLTKPALLHSRLLSLPRLPPLNDIPSIYQQIAATGYIEDECNSSDNHASPVWLQRRFVLTNVGLAVSLRDITERKGHADEVAWLTNADTLTGLPNRYWLARHLATATDRCRSEAGRIALLSLDMDYFKNVNDAFGHSVGDDLLKAIAVRLRRIMRPADQVVRLGGDEFVVVVEAFDDLGSVENVAHRLLHAFDTPFRLGEQSHQISTSIGIALFPNDASDSEQLHKHADIAMYAAKEAGKARYQFYSHGLFEQIRSRIEIENELERAIAEGQFVVHYQPRIDSRTRRLAGMEALVRWHHPENGMIAPNHFIPLAEQTGLIVPLGELVIHEVCRQIVRWRREEVALIPVSINVSARQFDDARILPFILACLKQYAIPSHLIEIELTESAMMGDIDRMAADIEALKAHGIRIHIDDFGTGYSSLSLLRKLDMDTLKIDRSFTAELDGRADHEIFIRAIVAMAHSLNMRVVAEGVETAEQLAALVRLQCDELQGYYLSRPLPASLLSDMLSKERSGQSVYSELFARQFIAPAHQ